MEAQGTCYISEQRPSSSPRPCSSSHTSACGRPSGRSQRPSCERRRNSGTCGEEGQGFSQAVGRSQREEFLTSSERSERSLFLISTESPTCPVTTIGCLPCKQHIRSHLTHKGPRALSKSRVYSTEARRTMRPHPIPGPGAQEPGLELWYPSPKPLFHQTLL